MPGFFLTIFPQYTEGQPNFGNARILGTLGPPIPPLLKFLPARGTKRQDNPTVALPAYWHTGVNVRTHDASG